MHFLLRETSSSDPHGRYPEHGLMQRRSIELIRSIIKSGNTHLHTITLLLAGAKSTNGKKKFLQFYLLTESLVISTGIGSLSCDSLRNRYCVLAWTIRSEISYDPIVTDMVIDHCELREFDCATLAYSCLYEARTNTKKHEVGQSLGVTGFWVVIQWVSWSCVGTLTLWSSCCFPYLVSEPCGGDAVIELLLLLLKKNIRLAKIVHWFDSTTCCSSSVSLAKTSLLVQYLTCWIRRLASERKNR